MQWGKDEGTEEVEDQVTRMNKCSAIKCICEDEDLKSANCR